MTDGPPTSDEFFDYFPHIFAYFCSEEEGKIMFNFNENAVDIEVIMTMLSDFVTKYLNTKIEQNKENTDGQKEDRKPRKPTTRGKKGVRRGRSRQKVSAKIQKR